MSMGERVDVTVDDIIGNMRAYLPEFDEESIRKADRMSEVAHQSQSRLSGDPYIIHPRNVALLLTELKMDAASVVAGLLHDVVEDTSVSEEVVEQEFGEEVKFLVQGVTKLGQIELATSQETQMENLRRMLLATAKDLRVMVIKFCDRLHNMRTLKYLPLEKQVAISRSTMDIYAPLAHRMGMGRLKWELEDLSFSFLEPEAYRDIREKIDQKRADRVRFVNQIIDNIRSRLAEENIPGEVMGRAKHFHSIFMKMQRDNKQFEEIYDLIAIRILTHTTADCYAVLGAVHSLYPHVDGRVKDYISTPKQNGYRSIHTTVMGPRGRNIEVQIRTYEMHRVAEEGIAAHWRYKEDRSDRKLGPDAKWLQELSSWIRETKDPEEFMESLKTNVFEDEIFIYTPKGDLIRLPRGATAIDFAYKIHTDLGNTCVGAKVGGKFIPLSRPLESGMMVEIVKARNTHPSPDWLTICKTPRAKSKIRKYLLDSRREELLAIGKNILNKEISRTGRVPSKVYASERMQRIIHSLGLDDLDNLFVQIGFGRVSTRQVLSRLLRKEPKARRPHTEAGPSNLLNVREVDGVLYRRAKCCNPVPGERIVGIVTKHRGISIHKASCRAILNFRDEERKMDLFWDTSKGERHTVEIHVEAKDRERLLADLSSKISSTGTNILGCRTVSQKTKTARLDFTIEVMDIDHLNTVINRLIDIEGVQSVFRRRRQPVGGKTQKK
jgi:GTP diphosphokinase / guanosine-3',5'-bis(diphosphate) 3'-diphosphatase